jgi:hypothetical protein
MLDFSLLPLPPLCALVCRASSLLGPCLICALVTLFLFAFDVFSGDEFGVGAEVLCRGFVNRSAIGVYVWRFVEGGEHGGAIRDGGSMSLLNFRSRNGGETLRAAINNYMATNARLR